VYTLADVIADVENVCDPTVQYIQKVSDRLTFSIKANKKTEILYLHNYSDTLL
jgi:hypothetical protein